MEEIQITLAGVPLSSVGEQARMPQSTQRLPEPSALLMLTRPLSTDCEMLSLHVTLVQGARNVRVKADDILDHDASGCVKAVHVVTSTSCRYRRLATRVQSR